MSSNLVLIVVFFVIGVAILAGIGIGLVIGLALGSRAEEAPLQRRLAPAPEAPLAQPEMLAPGQAGRGVSAGMGARLAPVATAPPSPAPAQGRQTAWSIALAIGVIVVCCVCTFLAAALATVRR